MILEVGKQTSYLCPEGVFHATLQSIREHKDKNGNSVARLTMEVDVPGNDEVTFLVARNFPPSLDRESPLRSFLESWLGAEYFLNLDRNHFDLSTLNGRKAVIVVNWIKNKSHREPFRNLELILPEGTVTGNSSGIHTCAPRMKRIAPKHSPFNN